VVASSRDGGGDSGSGAMCSVLHTRVSHLHFAGFGFLQVVHTVPGNFGCVYGGRQYGCRWFRRWCHSDGRNRWDYVAIWLRF